MHLFLKITAVVAVAIVALLALMAIIKIVFVAALIALLVMGGLFIAGLFRRRRSGPLVTYDARRYR